MRYQIADFSLDTDQFELSQSGNLIHLEPQALELLVLLIEKRNQVVSVVCSIYESTTWCILRQ